MVSSEAWRLADAHRVAQSRLAAGVAEDLRGAWRFLDPGDLTRSFPRYAEAASAAVQARRAASSGLGVAFFRRVREAEGVPGSVSPLPAIPLVPGRLSTSLAVTGPVALRSALARGADPLTAQRAAFTASVGAAQRHILDGGRSAVSRSIAADSRARGYMRVSDGSPCAFCAMLVSRGAVYKESTGGFRAHDSCGCNMVPFWEASPSQSAQADEIRALWDSTYPNEGYAGFRRAYEKGLAPRRSVTAVAEVQDALTPAEEAWLVKWRAAAAALPEDKSRLGRVSVAAEPDAGMLSYFDDGIAKAKRGEDAWRAVGFDVTGDNVTQSIRDMLLNEGISIRTPDGMRVRTPAELQAAWAERIQKLQDARRDYVAGFAGKSEWVADVTPDGLLGATANAHLDSVLAAGRVLDDELERRIQARALAVDLDEAIENLTKADADYKSAARAYAAEQEKAIQKVMDAQRADIAAGKFVYTPLPDGLSPADVRFLAESGDWPAQRVMAKVNKEANKGTLKRLRLAEAEAKRNLARAEDAINATDMIPGTAAYAEAMREETLRMLSDIRQMGGEQKYLGASGKPIAKGATLDAMRFADSSYPAEWHAKQSAYLKALGKDGIDLGTSSRGYNQGGYKIRLSKNSARGARPVGDAEGMYQVAVHELGHSFEHSVPGLDAMEWAFHRRRSPRTTEKISNIYGPSEKGYRDSWASHYTGKVYRDAIGGQWEIFTTGVESLLSGSPYLERAAVKGIPDTSYDREFRAWLLGVLSVL